MVCGEKGVKKTNTCFVTLQNSRNYVLEKRVWTKALFLSIGIFIPKSSRRKYPPYVEKKSKTNDKKTQKWKTKQKTKNKLKFDN